MEAVKLNEPPSSARRQLSERLSLGAAKIKQGGSLASLRQPSIFNIDRDDLLDNEDDDPPPPGAMGGRGVSRGVSVNARQASGFSRVFALSSTSESFHEYRILPTVIIAMIALGDPDPDVDGLRRTLGDRLLEIPRFRCVVRAGRGKEGGIVFEPLARSDVRLEEHILHVDGGKSFGAQDIEELINDAYLSEWDSSMPRWRMKIVTNTKDGRSLLFVAIDHAIGDGVGLISVFLSLFDNANTPGEANVDKTKPQKERKKPQGLPLSHRAVAFLKGIRAGSVDVIIPPPSDPMHMLMIPKDRLNDPCPGKSFAQTRAFPLSEVKMMKNKLRGATVNDLIMALLAMTIKQYLETKGDTEALDLVRGGRGAIRASFPVNMRGGRDSDDRADLGNNIVMGSFPFPVNCEDPIDCVWRTKILIDEMKVSPAFALQKWILDAALPIAPDTELAKTWVDNSNRTTCVISNVMGPAGAASLGGCPIEDIAFTAAFASGLYFGVLSFGGNLRVSGILDRKIEGDVAELMKCYEESYDNLKAALGDVNENKPLERPDMRPLSAKILELLFCAFIILLPVFVASKLVS